MKRISLNNRILPIYSRGEEIMNMTTHIIGSVMGVVILLTCVIKAALHYNTFNILSAIVFGLSTIVLYTMSAIYHGLSPDTTAKKVFQVLDHCSIFVLIAGTYTPILLSSLYKVSPQSAIMLLIIVSILSIIGIVMNAIDLENYKYISMLLYLGIGWCIVFKIHQLALCIHFTGTLLLALGGVAYTIGVVFYGLQKRIPYMHSIWHIFILIGTFLHFMCILFFVI